jgi:hypothetical protein
MESVTDYKTQIEKNGVIAFVPGGNSMWPMLKHRKQSVIVQKKDGRLKKFDVGFYQRDNGAFVLHRVMQVVDGGYVMCGDSQFTLEKVKEENVFGIMTGFYEGETLVEVTDKKYIKKVQSYYKNKTLRKIRLKCFYFILRVKNKLKRIFCGKKKGENND